MRDLLRFCLTTLTLLLGLAAWGWAEDLAGAAGKLTIHFDADGNYRIVSKDSGWQLAGKLPSPAEKIASATGHDAVGAYQQVTFYFTDSNRPMSGFIRLYDEKPVVLFSESSDGASKLPPPPFPNFTTVPDHLFSFSYQDRPFSPPQFNLQRDAGPWLFFDGQDHALILSPASHFPVAMMIGDGKTQIASGFNAQLRNIPAGFTQQSVLVMTQGINHAFDLWGQSICAWEGKRRIPNDADRVLKYFGYWTDNGGAYWYNYDLHKGYQQTLEDLMNSYREKGIPFGYLQLDSWWYHKTLTGPNGKQQKPKNSKLPEGDWNRYGGTIEYTAHPFIFPKGMKAFHDKVGLPFVTHNRWIDPVSPYHQRFKFSGIAAIDPGFWDEIGGYLHDNGVICYEQDWLNEILKNSPRLSSTPDEGEAFYDSMAGGCAKHGLSMQYCMATPRSFLQGSKYGNLTSIRVCDDHFIPARYHDFLYVSKLASALGEWPFADVFQSFNTSGAIMSTLSAGPVGSGDALGMEKKDTLLKIVRADGVIVKPDVPVVALDRAYLAEAEHRNEATIAITYTDHQGLKTIYVVACKTKPTQAEQVSIRAGDLGWDGAYYFFDDLAGTGTTVAAGADGSIHLHGRDFAYYIAAPIGGSGIAFLGDADRYVGTGKKRIAALKDEGRQLTATVVFAEKEQKITLHGYAPHPPTATVESGTANPVTYDAATGLFSVTIEADEKVAAHTEDGESIRNVTVVLR